MNGWRLRLFVGVERLLARLGLKLPGKIMYIGGSDTLPPPPTSSVYVPISA